MFRTVRHQIKIFLMMCNIWCGDIRVYSLIELNANSYKVQFGWSPNYNTQSISTRIEFAAGKRYEEEKSFRKIVRKAQEGHQIKDWRDMFKQRVDLFVAFRWSSRMGADSSFQAWHSFEKPKGNMAAPWRSYFEDQRKTGLPSNTNGESNDCLNWK